MEQLNGGKRKMELTTNVDPAPGSHIVYTYTDENKYIENVISFIAEGIDNDQRIIYIDVPNRFATVKSHFKNASYSEEQINAIIFIEAEEFYGTHDFFNLDYISKRFDQLVSPYLPTNNIIRIWGFVSWKAQSQHPLLQKVATYEADFDIFASENRNIINVCSYDAETLPYSLLIELLKTHEYHMTDTNLSFSHLYKRKPMQFPSITEQINFEKKEQDRQIRLEKLSIVGELAANVAHGLRNPLAVIKSSLQLLENMGDLREKDQRYVDTISGEVEKMEQITSEFLALAKTHVENRIEVSALTLVEDVINLMSAQSDAKSIDISVEVGHYDMTMMCDEAKIKQVLINVIKNAIEAMDQGTIRIVMRDATDFIHIYVIDNGPGMSDEVLYQLGNPFMTTKEDSAGLGLFISEKIIESHDGTFIVDSEIDKGTTLTIHLPKS